MQDGWIMDTTVVGGDAVQGEQARAGRDRTQTAAPGLRNRVACSRRSLIDPPLEGGFTCEMDGRASFRSSVHVRRTAFVLLGVALALITALSTLLTPVNSALSSPPRGISPTTTCSRSVYARLCASPPTPSIRRHVLPSTPTAQAAGLRTGH